MKKKIIRSIAIILLLTMTFSICLIDKNMAKENLDNHTNTNLQEEQNTTINDIKDQQEQEEETEKIENKNESNHIIVEESEEETVIEEKQEQEEIQQMIEEQPKEEETKEEMMSNQTRKIPNLKDGIYTIQSKIDEQKVFEVEEKSTQDGKKVKLADKLLISMSQNIKIKYLNNGYYSLTFENSNKVLDVPGASTASGTILQQYHSNGTDAQQWILEEDEQGYYSIISKCSGLYIEIPNGKATTGSSIQLSQGNNMDGQKFKIEKVEPVKSEKTIPEGLYYISSALSKQKVLTIAEGKSTNAANLQIEDKGKQYQKFKISYDNGLKAYTITAFHSDKVLDVAGAGQANYTNVQQYERNQSKAQQWIIQKTEDGYYSIISKCNYLFLDLNGSSTKNGNNIQVYEPNGTKAQKFTFEKIEDVTCERVLPDGIYKIVSALNHTKVLDIAGAANESGGNLQIWEANNVQQQKFELLYHPDEKYYEIKALHSQKAWDVVGGGKTDGTNVWQYENNHSEAQKWALKDAGNGHFYIIAVHSGLYLDVAGASTANGNNVQVFTGNQTKAQMFQFTKTKMIEEGYYQIAIQKNETKALDVLGKLNIDGANIQIWNKENVSQQFFYIQSINDTMYKIIAKHSKKVLTVNQNNNVEQRTDQNSEDQKWMFESVGNGYYKLKSVKNGYCLDVAGAGTANGTNIQVYQENHTTAQLFKLNKIIEKSGIDVSFYQELIDWREVSQTEYADFAMIRAGYRGYGAAGTLMTDIQFINNIKGAKANNIDIGLYFFTQAINVEEAIQEAHYVLNLVNLAKSLGANITYPIAIDTETANGGAGRADGLDVATRTAVCKAFCDTIRNAGYIPAIYASRNWFYDRLDVNQLRDYDIWVAHYTGSVENKTNYRYDYDMWQYTSAGRVNGIIGNVDLNISYKNY